MFSVDLLVGAIVLGMLLGSIAGYSGGIVDDLISRVVDVLMAFPGILLAIALVLCQRPVADALAGWRFNQELTLLTLGLIGMVVYGCAVFVPIGWRVLVVRR